jgi:RimJ/RimL family protein N-acetyltransferase
MTSIAPALVPPLETERLTLTGHTLADFPHLLALWSDPQVVRHIGNKPSTPEQTWARLLRYTGHWAHLGFGYWVVREKRTGRFAGEVGFANFHRDITPALGDDPEGGWVLAPWASGQGFATEAMRRALAWITERVAPKRTFCLIDVDNTRSIRVAHKLGYREASAVDFAGHEVLLCERLHSPDGAALSKGSP